VAATDRIHALCYPKPTANEVPTDPRQLSALDLVLWKRKWNMRFEDFASLKRIRVAADQSHPPPLRMRDPKTLDLTDDTSDSDRGAHDHEDRGGHDHPTEEPTITKTEEPTITKTEEPTITKTDTPTITKTETPTLTKTEEPTTTTIEPRFRSEDYDMEAIGKAMKKGGWIEDD
jgi:hypothetical protein